MAKDYKRPGYHSYIVRGYQIDFHTKPWQKHIPKTSTTGERITLMQQEIDKRQCPRPTHIRGDLQSSILCAQEKRLISPSHRLKSPEQIYNERIFPNGKFNVLETSLKSKRLYGQIRHEGRLSNGGCSPTLATVPSVYLARTHLSVPSPTVRTKHSATNIYEAVKTVGAFLRTRNIRLLIYLEILKYILVIDRNAKGSHNSSNRFVAILRIYNQLQEVGLDAFPRTRIPGVLDKLENNEYLPTSGEDSKRTQCRQIFNAEEPNVITSSLPVPGHSRILPPSSLGGFTSDTYKAAL
jgi:hypothetical protein